MDNIYLVVNSLMSFERFTQVVADTVFGLPLTLLLLAAGIYFSFRTKFVQIRKVGLMSKLLFSRNKSDKGISAFQAFSIALAGRVGTGNIAGVATAIALGGPGALFWMWILAIFGASTAYVESTLAQIYKKEIDGEYRGGPAYYFEKVSGKKIFGAIFAVITVIAMALQLPAQSSSIAIAVQQAFFADATNVNLVKIGVGVFVVILLAIIIIGGTRRVGHATEVIVPIMSIAYVIFALIIIATHITMLPDIFAMIFKYAFTPVAGLGGVVGTAILNGVKRGIYSNEAGRGSGAHAAAAAAVNHPSEQGLVAALSVYFDTLLMCTATGLIILITGSYFLQSADGMTIAGQGAVYGSLGGTGIEVGPEFTQNAISSLLGENIGYKFVAIALFFFASTTCLADYYIAETNVAYLTAKRDKNGILKSNHLLINFIRLLFFAIIIFFASYKSTEVFNLADTGTALMAWYNVIGILIISIPAFKALKDFEQQLKAGVKNPNFDPKKLDIKNTEVW